MELGRRGPVKAALRQLLKDLKLERTGYTTDIDGTGCYNETWQVPTREVRYAPVRSAKVSWQPQTYVITLYFGEARAVSQFLGEVELMARPAGFMTEMTPDFSVVRFKDTDTGLTWLSVKRLRDERENQVLLEGWLPPVR